MLHHKFLLKIQGKDLWCKRDISPRPLQWSSQICDEVEHMPGSHNARLARPDRDHQFEVSAQPAHPLSRIPVLGPFITYNLGRNPKFNVSVKYLGYVAFEGEPPDPSIC